MQALNAPAEGSNGMFERFHIETKNAPLDLGAPRILVERKESCINCGICVAACVYGVHERRPPAEDFTRVADPRHELCVACHRCVYECPMQALRLHPHPEFRRLGDAYYDPDLIETLSYEAETGRVPVSGQGYRGPFAGPGFDSIWTDMSEIVRPTRDGIHGREAISTEVELGRRPLRLEFGEGGKLLTRLPPSVRLPFPIFINVLPIRPDERLLRVLAAAARDAGTLLLLEEQDWDPQRLGSPAPGLLGLRLKAAERGWRGGPGALALAELEDDPQAPRRIESLKAENPSLVVSIRLPLDASAPERAVALARAGAEALHLAADHRGRSLEAPPRFLHEALRRVCDRLVEAGLRDAVTLLVSGGIARAEHVPKAMLCGADAVGVDAALLVALGLRHFDSGAGRWEEEEVRGVEEEPGRQRLLNLLNAWRDQLLEVMGAMGMRDARRLEGETGRAMFHEELEAEFRACLKSGPAAVPAAAVPAAPAGDCSAPPTENSSPRRGDEFPAPSPGGRAPVPSEGDPSSHPTEKFAPPPAVPAPSEIWRKVAKFAVDYTKDCIDCGLCVSACPYGVHKKKPGHLRMQAPESHACIGPSCKEKFPVTTQLFPTENSPPRGGRIPDALPHGEGVGSVGRGPAPLQFPAPTEGSIGPGYCVEACPYDAIRIAENPEWETLGDPRWTGDLLFSTWYQAEHGKVPKHGPWEHRTGASGGGFDRLGFRFLRGEPPDGRVPELDTSIELNRRPWGPRVSIPIPWYGGGMSYGSVSLNVMLSRARAARAWSTFTSTGEGGYPAELGAYRDHVITQVATGMFGVREDTIAAGRIVEIKYAQGAKPGLGGHLLSDKNTPAVAVLRETVPGISLFSPFPFHSVYSVEDHKKHVDWLHATADGLRAVTEKTRALGGCDILVSAKVSTPADVDMVAVGCYYGGVNIIHLDGSYGGTGAAPDIAKKNIAMPIEFAIPKVHRFLAAEGIRDQVTLIASGGLRTAHDVAKAIALGADGVVLGTSDLVAVQCTRCGNCESGRGCQHGIASTDPELSRLIQPDWGAQRIINLYAAFREELRLVLWRLGLESVRALRGRWDLLEYDAPEPFRP